MSGGDVQGSRSLCPDRRHTLTSGTWPASCIRCGWVNRLMTREEFRQYFGIKAHEVEVFPDREPT